MANYSPNDQIRFVLQWTKTWSEYQREDFCHVLGHKLAPAQFINGIVDGVNNMSIAGRPPTLFACQMKLFGDWWGTWTETERGKFTESLKETDGKFWAEIESEIDGSKKKRDDDFFFVPEIQEKYKEDKIKEGKEVNLKIIVETNGEIEKTSIPVVAPAAALVAVTVNEDSVDVGIDVESAAAIEKHQEVSIIQVDA